MRLVVDASVVVESCLSTAAFAPLDGHELFGPPLLWSEASSVLHEMAWRGMIDAQVASSAADRLQAAPIARYELSDSVKRSWATADQLGWAKTYDAEYVSLALELAAPLLTIDERLRRGIGDFITVLGPLDLI